MKMIPPTRLLPNLLLALTSLVFTTASAQIGGVWSPAGLSASASWAFCASSSNGVICAATCVNPPASRGLYTSTDSGATWTLRNTNFYESVAVAITSNGPMLGAITNYSSDSLDGEVCFSMDLGITWTNTGIVAGGDFTSLTCSPDGKTWMACYSRGGSHLSTNFGVTWTPISPPAGAADSQTVCCSSDGTILAADNDGQDGVSISVNSGATWTESFTTSDNYWTDIAMSTNGQTIIGSTEYDYDSDPNDGRALVFFSTNGGTNWTSLNYFAGFWNAVAVSADGQTMVAASIVYDVGGGFPGDVPGLILTSTNSGQTWTFAPLPNTYWATVAVSGDGSTLLALPRSNPEFPAQPSRFITANASAPVLGITTAGTSAYVTWPFLSPGYALQQSSSLSNPNWITVTNSPAVVNQVITAATNANNFYRLALP
jgi:hypothetical protein